MISFYNEENNKVESKKFLDIKYLDWKGNKSRASCISKAGFEKCGKNFQAKSVTLFFLIIIYRIINCCERSFMCGLC